MEKAQAHYSPKPSLIVNSIPGNKRNTTTYGTELRKIGKYCEYGPVLSDMLRDHLVCGTHKTTQRWLLEESELTFEKALEVPLSTEAAEDSKRLTSQPAQIGRVNNRPSPNTPAGKGNRCPKSSKPQQQCEDKQQQDSDNSGKECHRCGGRHEPSTCPFKHYECRFYKKKGHLA